jgi:hypothetical protein
VVEVPGGVAIKGRQDGTQWATASRRLYIISLISLLASVCRTKSTRRRTRLIEWSRTGASTHAVGRDR